MKNIFVLSLLLLVACPVAACTVFYKSEDILGKELVSRYKLYKKSTWVAEATSDKAVLPDLKEECFDLNIKAEVELSAFYKGGHDRKKVNVEVVQIYPRPRNQKRLQNFIVIGSAAGSPLALSKIYTDTNFEKLFFDALNLLKYEKGPIKDIAEAVRSMDFAALATGRACLSKTGVERSNCLNQIQDHDIISMLMWSTFSEREAQLYCQSLDRRPDRVAPCVKNLAYYMGCAGKESIDVCKGIRGIDAHLCASIVSQAKIDCSIATE